MSDDGVREIHGVSNDSHYVRAREVGSTIIVASSNSLGTLLTPDEARYFGRQLLRLASRIDQRNGVGADESPQAKGGRARAASMTPELRREQASNAARKRWKKQ